MGAKASASASPASPSVATAAVHANTKPPHDHPVDHQQAMAVAGIDGAHASNGLSSLTSDLPGKEPFGAAGISGLGALKSILCVLDRRAG